MLELFLITALSFSNHPIAEWVCDGRQNNLEYCYYDSKSAHIVIEKDGYMIEDMYYIDEIVIWYFPQTGFQWIKFTDRTKLEFI